MILKLANISNGLFYNHDDVCHFQSNYGHHKKLGYFRIDSMPYRAVVHILKGGQIEIIDATAKEKPLTDALRMGVPTWCLVMNKAMGFDYREIHVCEWQDKHMVKAVECHEKYINSIRKLVRIYGPTDRPLVVGDQVLLTCYKQFVYNDKMKFVTEDSPV